MNAGEPLRLDLSWLLVLLLTVLAIAPLAYPGYFETQSGFLPVFRVTHLADASFWGQVDGRSAGEGNLPYILAWPFYLITGSGIAAIKWAFALAFLLGAVGTYAWTRRWLGKRGGVLAAVVYTYLPWHLSTVYVRGAYAEAWLWALWPFMLWALDRLSDRKPVSVAAGLAIGLACLAAAFWIQPGLAALALPVLTAYAVVVSSGQSWRLLRLVEAITLLLLLLWLVARRLPEAQGSFAGQFLAPFELLSAGSSNGLSFQLGVAAAGLGMVAVALWLGRGSEEKAGQRALDRTRGSAVPLRPSPGRAIWFWGGCLLLLGLLSLPLSAWLWKTTGFDSFLAYPWQVLAFSGLPLAFLAGLVICLDNRLATPPAWAGLAALVVLASYPYLSPSFTQVDPGLAPVAVLQPVEASAPQVLILDYDAVPPTEITPTVGLTLTWQAIEQVSGDYTVFVHLLTEDDEKIAQLDRRPCGGECPTDTWLPGQIVRDRYELSLVPDATAGEVNAPSGPYRLAVGLYLLDSGERAVVLGRDDRSVVLDVN